MFSGYIVIQIILASYDKWGAECLQRLEGVFSFVLYDCHKGKIFGARDHFGVKPLYYSNVDGVWMLASEIKALLTQVDTSKVNNSLIFEYMISNNAEHREETFFSDIMQVMPGECFTIHDGVMSKRRYYDIKNKIDAFSQMTVEEADAKFLNLLIKCTADSVSKYKSVGVSFSAGLDSASLLAAAKCTDLHDNIYAITAVSSDTCQDEVDIFSDMFHKYGVEGRFVDTTSTDIASRLNVTMYYLEMPFPFSSLAYENVFSNALENGCRAVLHGQAGGAVQASGLSQYSAFLIDIIRHGEFDRFGKEFSSWNNNKKFNSLMKSLIHYYGPNFIRNHGRTVNRVKGMMSDAFMKDVEIKFPDKQKGLESVMQNITYDSLYTGKQPRMLRVLDRFSQWYGCEIRMPYLDKRLIEFLFSVPDNFKIEKGISKMLVRRSMSNLIAEYTFKKKKNTFMQDHLSMNDRSAAIEFLLSLLIDERARSRNVYCQTFVSNLLADKENNYREIMMLGQIELWYRMFVDGEYTGYVSA